MKEQEEIELKKLLLKFQPWWYVFVICIALALGAAYVFNTLSEPMYLAKSTILISEGNKPSPLMPEMARLVRGEGWRNEIAILQSNTLVDKAVKNMDVNVYYYIIERVFGLSRRTEIYKDSPFRVIIDKSHTQPFGERFRITILSEHSYTLESIDETIGFGNNSMHHFGDSLVGEGYSFMLNMVVPFDEEKHREEVYEFVILNINELAPRYASSLNVEPLGRDYSIVEITFRATNQWRALDFLSSLADMYIQQNLAEKNHMAQSTILFVDDQLAEVSDELRDTELSLQRFRQRHQVMEVGPAATQLSRELEELDRQKSIEQVKRQYYDLLMEYVRDDREFSEVFGPSALGINDPLLNSLLMDLSKLHNERARMLLTSTISTPSVQAIEENIRHSKANLQENLQSLKAANDIIINDLNQRISRIEQRINQLPQTERELINLQRVFNLNEATYNYLMEKRAETGIVMASMIPDHRVVDPARLDGLIAPKKAINYAIALGIGILIPFIFVVMRDFFNTRILEMEDVSRALDFPIVGLIPHYPKIKNLRDPNPVLFDEIQSPIVEAFRSMRSNLILLAPKTKSKLIVVTSTREQEGKTFTALKLAGSLHLLKRKTIYINTDMRKPSDLFHNNISRNVGLSTFLTGNMELDELISLSEKNDNLNLIPSGKMPPNAAELLESEAMDQLLERLRLSFEYIIMDTPPVGLVSDAKSLLTRADIVIYIFRHGKSQHMDLNFLRDLARNASLKKVAIAINDVRGTGRYGYGYGYGYGLGYGIGYGEKKKPERKKSS